MKSMLVISGNRGDDLHRPMQIAASAFFAPLRLCVRLPPKHERAARRDGFSLVELMVVLTVIAIMAVFAVPSYQRAIEQSRADMAAADLRSIWAAQRLYWLDNHAYTTDLAGLRTSGLIDPQILTSTSGYTFAVASADSGSFQATATPSGETRWSGQFTIDETGSIGGALQATGEPNLVPGFQ